MPFTDAARNFMLDALRGTGGITHVGAFDADPSKSGTAAATDLISIAAHGYAAGDLVVFTTLTGGTGLVLGKPYFVIAANLAAGAFSVSSVPGGSPTDITVAYTAVTAVGLVELSGGAPAYARKAIAFNAAAAGSIDDSTNGATLDIPAGAAVDFLGLFSALTAGTAFVVQPVTQETFTGQGTYTVSDADLDLLAA